MEHTELRKCISDVEKHLGALDEGATQEERTREGAALRAAWARLVAALALGPEPETRSCPHCGRTIMRDATRCLHCWAKRTPPAKAPTA